MKVVSNASPLINLAAIGQLELLRRLYGQVTISRAVRNEVVRRGVGKPGSRAVRVAPWIRVKAARDSALVEMLLGELDLGEAESIVLAREVRAHLLLLDDSRARRAAERLGLPITGLVGVLVDAARKGFLPDLAGALQSLRETAGFWLAQEVVDEALRLSRRVR